MPGPKRVYGGTVLTFEMYADKSMYGEYTWFYMTCFNLVDLPLCMVADTCLLPKTLYWNIRFDANEREEMDLEEYSRNRGLNGPLREERKLEKSQQSDGG